MNKAFKYYLIIILLLLLFINHRAFSLEINYRLLSRPDIQRLIETKLEAIEKDFALFLSKTIPLFNSPAGEEFLYLYGTLGPISPQFRKDCVYSILDKLIFKKNSKELLDLCLETTQNIKTSLKHLDQKWLQLMTSMVVLDKISFFDSESYLTPSFQYLSTYLFRELPYLQLASTEIYFSLKNNIIPADYTMDFSNRIGTIKKVIRNSLLILINKNYRQDVENFWIFYIDSMQEKIGGRSRQDYWLINSFQLNLKVNEFFYSCERNKNILPKEAYKACEDLHTDWNTILRSTLKF